MSLGTSFCRPCGDRDICVFGDIIPSTTWGWGCRHLWGHYFCPRGDRHTDTLGSLFYLPQRPVPFHTCNQNAGSLCPAPEATCPTGPASRRLPWFSGPGHLKEKDPTHLPFGLGPLPGALSPHHRGGYFRICPRSQHPRESRDHDRVRRFRALSNSKQKGSLATCGSAGRRHQSAVPTSYRGIPAARDHND